MALGRVRRWEIIEAVGGNGGGGGDGNGGRGGGHGQDWGNRGHGGNGMRMRMRMDRDRDNRVKGMMQCIVKREVGTVDMGMEGSRRV